MQTLKTFEFKDRVASSGVKHDWDKLLDGKIYKLYHGDDYNCKTGTISMMARARAKKRGLLIKVNKFTEGEGDAKKEGVVLQAVPNPNAPAAPPVGKGKKTAPTPAAKPVAT